MLKYLRPSLALFVGLTVITGIVYPLVVTICAQAFFPHAANGSLVRKNGIVVGSELIGQPFTSPAYFWSRPSATLPYPYNASGSGGSNFGPLNPALAARISRQVHDLSDPASAGDVPVDLVTASASGLDPHISIASALYQIPRVARNRHMSGEELRALIVQNTEERQFGFLGEPRVNVLRLNLALDEREAKP